MTEYRATVSSDNYTATVASNTTAAELSTAVVVNVVHGEHYAGAITITPSDEAQTLKTAGLFMDDNITIEPIPSNYGLISWNGAILTVS